MPRAELEADPEARSFTFEGLMMMADRLNELQQAH